MKLLILFFTLFLHFKIIAQESVTLTVTGQGSTANEAKLSAFRSAIEQAFGVFISSNSKILNDSLIKDEIVSISNGNIETYEILSEIQLPNGNFFISANVVVSIIKLSKFCENKGVEVEFKGELFASNFKLYELNNNSEIKAIDNLVIAIHKMLSICYDYSIEISDPKKNSNWNLYNVDINASAKANSNMKDVVLLIINTLKGLSIPDNQLESLINQGQSFYCIPIDNKPYFFRSFRTYISIKLLCEFWIPSFSSKFIITNGIQTIDIRELHKVIVVEFNKSSEGDTYTKFELFKKNNSEYIANHCIMAFGDYGIYDFELSKNEFSSHKVNGYDWRFGESSYSFKEFNKVMLDSYGSKEYQ
jgi:hypothetical protein